MNVLIELCFQNPRNGELLRYSYPWSADLKAKDVLAMAMVYENFPELSGRALGIYADLVDLEYVLAPGDRLEIYAPLKIDPKEARRRRAKGL